MIKPGTKVFVGTPRSAPQCRVTSVDGDVVTVRVIDTGELYRVALKDIRLPEKVKSSLTPSDYSLLPWA